MAISARIFRALGNCLGTGFFGPRPFEVKADFTVANRRAMRHVLSMRTKKTAGPVAFERASDLALRYGVSAGLIYKLVRTKQLPHRKFGRSVHIPVDAGRAFFEADGDAAKGDGAAENAPVEVPSDIGEAP